MCNWIKIFGLHAEDTLPLYALTWMIVWRLRCHSRIHSML